MTDERTMTKEDWVAMKRLFDMMQAVVLYGADVLKVEASSRCPQCGFDWPHYHDRKGNPVPIRADPETGQIGPPPRTVASVKCIDETGHQDVFFD